MASLLVIRMGDSNNDCNVLFKTDLVHITILCLFTVFFRKIIAKTNFDFCVFMRINV